MTIAGHPLYSFVTDGPGKVTGQGQVVGSGTFHVVSPSGNADTR